MLDEDINRFYIYFEQDIQPRQILDRLYSRILENDARCLEHI